MMNVLFIITGTVMNVIKIISLILLISMIIIQYAVDSSEDKKSKKILRIVFTAMAIVGIVFGYYFDYSDGVELEKSNDQLSNKLIALNSESDSLSREHDLILAQNSILIQLAQQTIHDVNQMDENTNLALDKNLKAIESIETVKKRAIEPQIGEQLKAGLMQLGGGDIRIEGRYGDQESIQYSDQFIAIFTEAGWNVIGEGSRAVRKSKPGIQEPSLALLVNTDEYAKENQYTLRVNTVYLLIKNLGIHIGFSKDPDPKGSSLTLFVGHQ